MIYASNDGFFLFVDKSLRYNMPFENGGRQFYFSISTKQNHIMLGVENGRRSEYDRSNAAMSLLMAEDYIT